jgi:iron complex outermembrane recepter protein
LLAYELGYRLELTRRCSLDVAGFYNDYDRIIAPGAPTAGFETNPLPPHAVVFSPNENSGPAHTYGVELSANWNVTDHWHLTAGYTWMRVALATETPFLEASPENQFQLRSSLDLTRNLELNGAVYYVEHFDAPYGTGATTIPSYVRLDLGLVWHVTKSLELGVWGQNLVDDRHPEFTSYKTAVITEIPRTFLAKITWRF